MVHINNKFVILLKKLRRLVKICEVFDNCIFLIINYILINTGLIRRRLITVRRGNCKVRLSYGMVSRIINLYARGFLRDFRCINDTLVINNVQIADIDLDTTGWAKVLGYKEINGVWVKDNIKFVRMRDSIIKVFELGEYEDIDVKGKVVIDVGAYVGESAIYFILRGGAERVYAIEPHPGAFREMLENIKLNEMQDKIVPINVALGKTEACIGKNGFTENIDETQWTYYSSVITNINNTNNCIKVMPLRDIIFNYKIKEAVLKMDCEGCEYDVLFSDYDVIKNTVTELIMEYHRHHDYSLTILMNLLNNDYECVKIKGGNKDVGIIHCRRKR